MDMPKQNTDKELFREVNGDYYSPSLHVTIGGLIGINVGGSVHVMSLREWHKLAELFIVKTETTHNSDYAKCTKEVFKYVTDNICDEGITRKEIKAILKKHFAYSQNVR